MFVGKGRGTVEEAVKKAVEETDKGGGSRR